MHGSGWFGERGPGQAIRVNHRAAGALHRGMRRRGVMALLLAGCAAADAPPAIFSLRPTAGPAGTTVQVSGKGFLPTSGRMGASGEDFGGNTVHFGPRMEIKNRNSEDGVSLEFSVPAKIAPGTYGVRVTNQNGASNAVNFTVTKR